MPRFAARASPAPPPRPPCPHHHHQTPRRSQEVMTVTAPTEGTIALDSPRSAYWALLPSWDCARDWGVPIASFRIHAVGQVEPPVRAQTAENHKHRTKTRNTARPAPLLGAESPKTRPQQTRNYAPGGAVTARMLFPDARVQQTLQGGYTGDPYRGATPSHSRAPSGTCTTAAPPCEHRGL